MRFAWIALAFCLLGTSCGYHVSGHADALPKTIKTIAIPAFGNLSTRYKLTDSLPAAIAREFITRTRYRVVADPSQADAVLNGAITNYFAFPIVSDQATGRATGVQVIVAMQMYLVDRQTGANLYARPNMEVRQRYEISIDQKAYFEESDAALQRLSQDVARSVVSAILEAF
ncbi:MAG TPA: LPS assembly lipoprotein LptE [Bryobacteraceae bacterium]|nr:LPS assembly lipoprotein LptE [Bryobacteraceae bacterium]